MFCMYVYVTCTFYIRSFYMVIFLKISCLGLFAMLFIEVEQLSGCSTKPPTDLRAVGGLVERLCFQLCGSAG